MESTIRLSKEMIRSDSLKQVSETLFEVDEHTVKIQKKSGRKIFLCDCKNSSIFADNNLCVHKIAVIIFLANKDFLNRLKKLTKEYEGFKENKLNPSVECFIDDLKSIMEKW